jgi:hypothetical protein
MGATILICFSSWLNSDQTYVTFGRVGTSTKVLLAVRVPLNVT